MNFLHFILPLSLLVCCVGAPRFPRIVGFYYPIGAWNFGRWLSDVTRLIFRPEEAFDFLRGIEPELAIGFTFRVPLYGGLYEGGFDVVRKAIEEADPRIAEPVLEEIRLYTMEASNKMIPPDIREKRKDIYITSIYSRLSDIRKEYSPEFEKRALAAAGEFYRRLASDTKSPLAVPAGLPLPVTEYSQHHIIDTIPLNYLTRAQVTEAFKKTGGQPYKIESQPSYDAATGLDKSQTMNEQN